MLVFIMALIIHLQLAQTLFILGHGAMVQLQLVNIHHTLMQHLALT